MPTLQQPETTIANRASSKRLVLGESEVERFSPAEKPLPAGLNCKAPVFKPSLGNASASPVQTLPCKEVASSCMCYLSNTSCPQFCTLYSTLPIPLPSSGSDSSNHFIRLICLKAGYGDRLLDCTLFTAPLSASTRFAALSYVWGDVNRRQPMIVNGRLVSIGENLHATLMHLRRSTSHVVLWADAICIDQNNLQERNYQVEQMPKIYAAAGEVVAWLGEAERGSDLAMEYITLHGRKDRPEHERCDGLTSELLDALDKLWSRAYWTRAWVVQELASACRSCTFRCGTKSAAYDVFKRFLSSFLRDVLFTTCDPILGPRRMLTLSSFSFRMPFLEVLWESALLQSTDPRDRIYGIRGISPKFYKDTIKVDYSIEFQKLCRRFVIHHIKKERRLDILCCFRQFPSEEGYPSWLSDLRNRINGMSPFAYSASGNRQASTSIVKGVLRAKGVRISIVDKVRGPYQLPPLLPWGAFVSSSLYDRKLEEMEEIAFSTLQTRYPDEDSDSQERRFWHMISGSRHGSSEAQCRQLWNRCSEVGLMAGGGTCEERRNFSFVFERLLDRCLFTTSDCHIGLGPPDLQKGDSICVLYGCNLCVILREMKQGHVYVGPAYLDGAMSGEYVPLGTSDENVSREQKFFIR